MMYKGFYLHYALLMMLLFPATLNAREINTDSLRKAIKAGTPHEQIAGYTALALYYKNKNFSQAVYYGNKGLSIAKEINDSLSIADINNTLGEALYFNGNYDKAAEAFFISINIYEKKQEQKKLGLSFNNIAKLYRKTRELDKAEDYYNKALDIYINANDTPGIIMIWNESGVVFEYRGAYSDALRRYQKALVLAEKTLDDNAIAYALSNIAGLYTIQKKYTDAEAYTLQALALRKKMKDSFALAINYSDLGKLNDSLKNYQQAIVYMDSSISIAEKMHYPQLIAENYEVLAHIYTRQNNHAEALSYYRKSVSLQDSLKNIDKTVQIEELNTKYQTEKKEQQIQVQQLEISRRNYIILGVCTVLTLGILLAYSYYKRNKIRQEKKIQLEILHQQKLAIQAVLATEENERQRIGQDLHDGVGQMMSAVKINLSVFQQNIPDLNEEELVKYENIMGLVDESCKEVRAISHNMMPNALLKAGLSSAVRDFINKIDEKVLEVNLYTEGLNERLNTDVETILYRVIQECVNNVIKHAGAKRLDISIIKDADGLSATIEDNGKGFDTTNTNVFEGIGLKNIRSRIQYLKGTVDFDSAIDRGTVVIIHLPYA